MELYKYLKFSDGLKVLQTGLIRFSPPQTFNDPFELKPNIAGFSPSDELDFNMERLPQILESEYQNFPPYIKTALPYDRYVELTKKISWPESDAQTGTQMLAPYLRKTFEDRLEKIVGILCLSESHENLTMWAHYGDKHQGMVIGFDTTHPYFQNLDGSAGVPCHLKLVIYHGSRPKLTWSGLASENIFLAKGEDWECEKEWRMFAQLDKAKIEQTEDGTIHLFPFPPESVTKVIIGCRAKPEAVDQVKTAMASNPNLLRDVLFKAAADPTNYCLNFHRM